MGTHQIFYFSMCHLEMKYINLYHSSIRKQDFGVFMAELWSLFLSETQRFPSPLTSLSLPFSDRTNLFHYIVWLCSAVNGCKHTTRDCRGPCVRWAPLLPEVRVNQAISGLQLDWKVPGRTECVIPSPLFHLCKHPCFSHISQHSHFWMTFWTAG